MDKTFKFSNRHIDLMQRLTFLEEQARDNGGGGGGGGGRGGVPK